MPRTVSGAGPSFEDWYDEKGLAFLSEAGDDWDEPPSPPPPPAEEQEPSPQLWLWSSLAPPPPPPPLRPPENDNGTCQGRSWCSTCFISHKKDLEGGGEGYGHSFGAHVVFGEKLLRFRQRLGICHLGNSKV